MQSCPLLPMQMIWHVAIKSVHLQSVGHLLIDHLLSLIIVEAERERERDVWLRLCLFDALINMTNVPLIFRRAIWKRSQLYTLLSANKLFWNMCIQMLTLWFANRPLMHHLTLWVNNRHKSPWRQVATVTDELSPRSTSLWFVWSPVSVTPE